MKPAAARRLISWFKKHGRDLPWRRTTDPYAIVVSEFMLQQTQVATVIPYYERWMKRFPDFASLARAGEHEVLTYWEGLGYYRRAQNLRRLAEVVTREWDGQLPSDVDQLRTLPGIGPYTAGAVAAFAFNLPSAAVDGNTARVLSRWFNFREPVDQPAAHRTLTGRATTLIPRGESRLFNSALMELGACVCHPRKPECGQCPIQTNCQAPQPEKLPKKRPRPEILRRTDRRVWVVCENKLLLETSASPPWAGLWRFPEASAEDELRPLIYSGTYSITRYRTDLFIYRAGPRRKGKDQIWVPTEQLSDYPLPAPYRKAVTLLLPLFAE